MANELDRLREIERLRAERRNLRAKIAELESDLQIMEAVADGWSGRCGKLVAEREEMIAIAREHHNTRIIGGAHAALREIMEIGGQGDE